MSAYKQLYVHFVWSTWDRLPLITAATAAPLYTALAAKARTLGCIPLAINGMPDHVHMLIEFSATITIARLVGELKGASSHQMTHIIAPDALFKWQGSYGAFSVGKRALPQITTYIHNQQQHHAAGTILVDFECLDD